MADTELKTPADNQKVYSGFLSVTKVVVALAAIILILMAIFLL